MVICVSKHPTDSVFRKATDISEESTASALNIEVTSTSTFGTAVSYSMEETRKFVFHFTGRILHTRLL
jgi:hypothetical protein